MVVAGETGFHFTPGSVAELRAWMERSSLHLAQLRAMRSKARRAFEASYTGAANVELLLAIYSKAQEAAGAAPRS
jgi:glycosyltransferase involved in cell wall biosynthesis